VRWRPRAAQLHVGQRLADVPHRDGDLVLPVERDVPGEHLEEDDPQGVQVALARDGVAERLLGRDVVRGPQDAPVRGELLLVEGAGDPEVRDLRRALLVHQDVLGLDVAVDDPLRVGGAERPGDLDRVGDRLGDRQPPVAADAVLERLALDVLEHDERAAVAVLAGVDDPDDVRVVELGDRAGLPAEALELVASASATSPCMTLSATWRSSTVSNAR
jgi:hypothetical protein